MNDPWEEFPYPNDLVCGEIAPGKYCDGILIHGWSRSYNCPKCGTHHDYDPYYIAALCEINLDKYPELREKYPCPFLKEEEIKRIEKRKKGILNEKNNL